MTDYNPWWRIERAAEEAFIFHDAIDEAAQGAGTAAANLTTTYRVPSTARENLGYLPLESPAAPAVAESVFVRIQFLGSDYKFQPQQAYAQIAGGTLSTINAQGRIGGMPLYLSYTPVSGSETWTIEVEALDAMAGDARAAMTLIYSDRPSGNPAQYGRATLETSTGTTAADTAGADIVQSGMRELVEYGGGVTGSTVTADEEITSRITLRCNAWEPVQQTVFYLEPAYAVELTSGAQPTQLARYPAHLRFNTTASVTVTSVHTHDVTLTAAGQFGHYIRYI
jgi:hypothetical protein